MTERRPLAGGPAGAEAKARAESLVGRTLLDRYRLEELVALGGIAAVFRATNLETKDEVAIKLLHPDTEELPEMIARFKREAIAGRRIYHPNVAAVYDIHQVGDGSWFMVMEFIRGQNLRTVLDDAGPLEAGRAARIAKQIAGALSAAHDLGIVHRDLKPANIMVLDGPEERVKVVDFGLARVPVEQLAVADEFARRSLTNAGVVFGTMAYMAPEAALGMRAVDKRGDLYALGVILYEMLAGKHPFTATEPAALFKQHRKDPPPPIAQRSPEVTMPPALEEIVMRLLQKDPDDRFPHARAVMVAFDEALAQMGESPGIASLRRVARGGLGAVVAVGAAVVVIVALAVWFFVSR